MGDALELDHPDRLQATRLGDAVDDGPADQHLPGGGPGGQAGGDVHGGAADVAVLEHHRAAVDPDVGWE
jgi:hypothetical protein